MKVYQVLLLVLFVVILNNFVLYQFFKPLALGPEKPTIEVSETKSDRSASFAQNDQTSYAVSLNELAVSDSLAASSSDSDVIIANAVKRFSNSDEFTAILDQYQMNVTKRHAELQKRYSQSSASELYAIAMESESPSEKQWALQYLIPGKLNDLDSFELKNLYDQASEDWWKPSLLVSLIEKNDDESLASAKQFIQNGKLSFEISSELFSVVYEKDPDFIKRYVESIDLAVTDIGSGIYTVLQEPELANIFYENNFDQILKSNKKEYFQYGAYNLKSELDDQQELALVELFGANNRHKRSFALSLVGKIKDTDRIRRAYSSLIKTSDQQVFLSQLLSRDKNSDQYKLALELAESSDKEELKQMTRSF